VARRLAYVRIRSEGNNAVGGGGPGEDPPAQAGGPMVHTLLTQMTLQAHRTLGRARSRSVWSRTHLGLMLPGRYYFVTLTSSPSSPPIKTSWAALNRWFKRHRPGSASLHVLTDEGHGVAHVVVRLKRNQSRIDVKALRAYWQQRHRATQIRIVPVTKSHASLERYLAEQGRRKKGLASEMANQVIITSWDYTRNWIPVGFTRVFRRMWQLYYDQVTADFLDIAVSDWIRQCAQDPDFLEDPPQVLPSS